MTCVVALINDSGGIFLGGDSFCGDENISNICRSPKVYNIGPIGVGLCGSIRAEQVLEKTLKYQIPRKENITHKWLKMGLTDSIRKSMQKHGCLGSENGIEEMKEASYILTFDGIIYHFDEDFGIWSSARPYTAIGAGRALALGALGQSYRQGMHNNHPEQAIREALEITEEWSPWVCSPYTIIKAASK